MTKEVTKAYILQQMQDKFNLREFEPAPFLFDETVVPVYNIEQHLVDWKIQRKDVTVNALSSFLVFTVPENERWTIRAYQLIFMTGAYTIAGVYIQRSSVATDYIYLDLKAAQSVSYLVNLPTQIVAEPNSVIRVNADGYTSAGTLRIQMDTQRETIR